MFNGETGWRPGNCLFKSKPSWWADEIGEGALASWAPEWFTDNIIHYSITQGMESTGTCTGAAYVRGTAPNLYLEDIGEPVTCTFENENHSDVFMPGSIDPASIITNGKAYLVYGGGYTWLAELNPTTGMTKNDEWFDESGNTPGYTYLASGPTIRSPLGDEGIMPNEQGHYWQEAPYIIEKSGFFYLFINWYTCCSTNSDYEIRVCRASKVDGPYLDKSGTDCTQGGGTLFKHRNDGSIGPGHASVFTYGNNFVFNNHYYRNIPSTPDVAFVSFVEHTVMKFDNEKWPYLEGKWDPASYWSTLNSEYLKNEFSVFGSSALILILL